MQFFFPCRSESTFIVTSDESKTSCFHNLFLTEFLLNELIQIYAQTYFSSKLDAPSDEYLVHISISTPSSINMLPKYWRGVSTGRTHIFLFIIKSIIFCRFFRYIDLKTRSFDLWVRWRLLCLV